MPQWIKILWFGCFLFFFLLLLLIFSNAIVGHIFQASDRSVNWCVHIKMDNLVRNLICNLRFAIGEAFWIGLRLHYYMTGVCVCVFLSFLLISHIKAMPMQSNSHKLFHFSDSSSDKLHFRKLTLYTENWEEINYFCHHSTLDFQCV